MKGVPDEYRPGTRQWGVRSSGGEMVGRMRFDVMWIGGLGVLALAGIGGAAWAGGEIVLGPSDGLALDQPRVAIEVIQFTPDALLGDVNRDAVVNGLDVDPFVSLLLNGSDQAEADMNYDGQLNGLDVDLFVAAVISDGPDDPGPGVAQSLGPEFSNTLLLDTAANGIMAVAAAVTEMQSAGYVTEAIYDEQGVAGFTPMDVSAAYRLDFAGDSGVRQTLSDVRILSNSSVNFGSFNGILGMPAMVGRTTNLDFSVWSGIAATFLGVDFSTAPPPGNGHRYTIPLELIDFPQNGQRDPDDPLPTWAPLPSAEVKLRSGEEEVQRRFLVDTGAQLSVISRSTAFALGLDRDGDGTFNQEMIGELPVGGIGGEVIMPVLEIDSLAVGTQEDVDLVWTNLTVGVLDIDASISGIFGMELLTSGWFQKVLFGTGPDGYLDQVHFDFRAADQMQGTMLLDINPDLDVPASTAMVTFGPSAATVPEPSALVLLITALLATRLIRVVRERRW